MMISISIFLGGCTFIVPEDDLNGSNKEIDNKNKFLKENVTFKGGQKTERESQLEQLDQAVAQASYNLQLKESELAQQSAPVVKEKTNIEREISNYYDKYTKATLVTNYGKIKVNFFNNDAPMAVGNFIKLAETSFYNNTKFHRVISGFMIQGGDPNSRDDNWEDDGKGGPDYSFADETNSHKLVKGALAMANSGKDTNGSQFFIVTADSTPHLDGKHTVFGEVIEGMDVVTTIEGVRINSDSHPTEDVIIETVELEK